jgi:hypothetical protein
MTGDYATGSSGSTFGGIDLVGDFKIVQCFTFEGQLDRNHAPLAVVSETVRQINVLGAFAVNENLESESLLKY